jgi:hypothetical protein
MYPTVNATDAAVQTATRKPMILEMISSIAWLYVPDGPFASATRPFSYDVFCFSIIFAVVASFEEFDVKETQKRFEMTAYPTLAVGLS